MLCILCLNQYQQILQVYKEPPTQIRFKKNKWVWGSLVILRLFLCISDDQHLAGLSKTFHNSSAMSFSLELRNCSIPQSTIGSIKSTVLVQTKMTKLQEYSDTKLWQHPKFSNFFDCYTCTQLLSPQMKYFRQSINNYLRGAKPVLHLGWFGVFYMESYKITVQTFELAK